jgi:hypothetical protein
MVGLTSLLHLPVWTGCFTHIIMIVCLVLWIIEFIWDGGVDCWSWSFDGDLLFWRISLPLRERMSIFSLIVRRYQLATISNALFYPFAMRPCMCIQQSVVASGNPKELYTEWMR